MAFVYASAYVELDGDLPYIRVPPALVQYLQGFSRRRQVEVVWKRLMTADMVLKQEPRFHILWCPFPQNDFSSPYRVHLPLKTEVASLRPVFEFFRKNSINIEECRSIDRKPLGVAIPEEAYSGGIADFLITVPSRGMNERQLRDDLAACLGLPSDPIVVHEGSEEVRVESSHVENLARSQVLESLAVPLIPPNLKTYFEPPTNKETQWRAVRYLTAFVKYSRKGDEASTSEQYMEPRLYLLPANAGSTEPELENLPEALKGACLENTYVNLQFDTDSEVLSAFIKDHREQIITIITDLVDEPGRLAVVYTALAELNMDARLINPDYNSTQVADRTSSLERVIRYHISGNITGSKLRFFDGRTIASIVNSHLPSTPPNRRISVEVEENNHSSGLSLEFEPCRRHKGFIYHPRQQGTLPSSLAIARSDVESANKPAANDSYREVHFDVYNEADDGIHLHLKITFVDSIRQPKEKPLFTPEGDPKFTRHELVKIVYKSLGQAYDEVKEMMGRSLNEDEFDQLGASFQHSFFRFFSDEIYRWAFIYSLDHLCDSILNSSTRDDLTSEKVAPQYQFIRSALDGVRSSELSQGVIGVGPGIEEAKDLLKALESFYSTAEDAPTKKDIKVAAEALRDRIHNTGEGPVKEIWERLGGV